MKVTAGNFSIYLCHQYYNMNKAAILFATLFFSSMVTAQSIPPLTVEKIMRDPKWIGSSPSNIQWSFDSRNIYFNWNPDNKAADSIYGFSIADHKSYPLSIQQAQNMLTYVNWNRNYSAYTYTKDGDIFYTEIKSGRTKRIVQTTDREANATFAFNDRKIVFSNNQNLFAWDIASGEIMQLTNIQPTTKEEKRTDALSPQEQWLKNDQLKYFEVLRTRKEKKDATDAYNKAIPKPKELRSIVLGDRTLSGINISPDGRFISYRLLKAASNNKQTIVPSYVTESGFTTDIPARSKVGITQGIVELYIYDREKDSVYNIKADSLPGITDIPSFYKDYPKQWEEKQKKPAARAVSFLLPVWSPEGNHALIDIRSHDNKDRWLVFFDTKTGKIRVADRQHDEAWIAGPGITISNTGWIDDYNCWFQSEESGYSHLYTMNVDASQKKALTSGKYEVQKATLSRDKKYFYITTNEVHPGEQQFYRLNIASGKSERITTMEGANDVYISPDEKYIAILYSYFNKPWELYLQENKPGGNIEQITNKAQSGEFKIYPWRVPELISFTARDGAQVYARIYKPANAKPGMPAVLFVHGAGYLQNAHKWWSSYFREYMFNNLLADNGYYVMDIDYRASAGYGRNWRTGIYRHMGGKDLEDNIDGIHYLIKTYNVDPKRVGLYGGSYGGFITLMALFTASDVFTSGAALRPVTDWANYNHGYTSNILNEPFTDSIAYRRSSPFYFAEGLKGHLLICHGMVDVNVHFQDAVKLSQRLIELGKDNWEMAAYPMEDHSFVEPSSWTDEYKRIFKLFDSTLKK